MAKRKSYSRSMTVPILPILGIASAFTAPSVHYGSSVLQQIQQGSWDGAVNVMKANFLGIGSDGQFHYNFAIPTWTALAIGFGGHYLASKLGVNRALGRAGVPILRL